MDIKKFIVLAVCVLCAAILVIFTISAFSTDRKIEALSEDERALLIARSYIYKEASTIILELPYGTVNLTQTALMKYFAGDQQAALVYLSERNDNYLSTCYSMMDEICADYKKLLESYKISSSSSEYTSYNNLSSMMSSLKKSSKELIKRATSFIKGGGTANDALYTSYSEQLYDLYTKINSYGSAVDDVYEQIMKALLGKDYNIVA